MNPNLRRELLDMCIHDLTRELEVPEIGTINFLGRGPEAIFVDPQICTRHYLLFFDPSLKIDIEFFIIALKRTWGKRSNNDVQIITPAYTVKSMERFLYIIEECCSPDKELDDVLKDIQDTLLTAKKRYLKIAQINTPPEDYIR